jgi:endonuclease YncB( thermonuclease family)
MLDFEIHAGILGGLLDERRLRHPVGTVMRRTIAARGAFLLALLGLSASAFAHPGPVSPKDGCHVCRNHCERYGIPPGRHCHPERLARQQEREQDAGRTGSGKAAQRPDPLAGRKAYVEKVVDGDTLKVRVDGGLRVTVRVLGIDCPESHANEKCARDGRQGRKGCAEQVPLGLEASRRAAALLKHRTVTLEGPTKRDLYGRTLAYVRLPDGRDFGALMVKDGLCEDFGWKYPHPRMKEYRR